MTTPDATPAGTPGHAPIGPRPSDPARRWIGAVGHDLAESADVLSFAAGPRSDWFRDPRSGANVASAPVAVMVEADPSVGVVTVSCRLRAELTATFDAAALFVHHDDAHWMKFAMERSPEGLPTLVSVRTAGWSDDCNHEVLSTADCTLRVTVDERIVALHVLDRSGDPDGHWRLLRVAPRVDDTPPTIGLLVQSPTGDGTRARFSELRVDHRRIDDLRDGT